MSAHQLCQRVHIHPPAQCRIIVPCPKIIGVYIKLRLVFLAAELVGVAVPKERGYIGKRNLPVVLEEDLVVAVITHMFHSPSASLRAGSEIVMVLLQNGYLVVVTWVLGVFQTDISQVVGVGEHIIEMVVRTAPQTARGGLYVAFGMREELKGIVYVLETIHVFCCGNRAAVGNLFLHFCPYGVVKILNLSASGKGNLGGKV